MYISRDCDSLKHVEYHIDPQFEYFQHSLNFIALPKRTGLHYGPDSKHQLLIRFLPSNIDKFICSSVKWDVLNRHCIYLKYFKILRHNIFSAG